METKQRVQMSDYKSDFFGILNNKGKMNKADQATRKNGFVVVVREPISLQGLQSLCFDTEQSWNQCFTLRYRVKNEPVFGTLLQAIFHDLINIGSEEEGAIYGDMMPDSGDHTWKEIMKSPVFRNLISSMSLSPVNQGELDEKNLDQLFQDLGDEKFLRPGKRFVIFCELTDEGISDENWQNAMSVWFHRLPERMGIVFSGIPVGLDIPTENPHFLELEVPEEEPTEENAFAYKLSGLSGDRPADQDRLNVERYAEALAQFVLHPDTRPLTIGIHGEWGKGKSSFMKFIGKALIRFAPGNRGQNVQQLEEALQELENLSKKQNSEGIEQAFFKQKKFVFSKIQKIWKKMEKRAGQDVISVEFNAWRFEDAKQIWAGLASVITEELENHLNWWRRLLLPLKHAWNRRRSEVIAHLLPVVLAVIIAGVVVLVSFQGTNMEVSSQQETSTAISQAVDALANNKSFAGILFAMQFLVPFGGSLLLLGFLTWRWYHLVQPVSRQVLRYSQMPTYRDQMGYQHLVLSDIKFVFNQLQYQRKHPRVVVFIDDLDRCSEEKIMEILQAIHLLLGESEFYVFLGVDTDMLYRAIRSHYLKGNENGELESGFERFYLRKIIQLSFHLPDATPDEMKDFLSSMFSPEARDAFMNGSKEKTTGTELGDDGKQEGESLFAYDLDQLEKPIVQVIKDVEDTGAELESFHDYSSYLRDNAREMKRLVNVHRFVKILLQRPGVTWAEEKQKKLVKWLFFCTCWPDLVDDLLGYVSENPGSVNCIRDLQQELPQEKEFAPLQKFADTGVTIAAADLTEDDALKFAAHISQMVRDNQEYFAL